MSTFILIIVLIILAIEIFKLIKFIKNEGKINSVLINTKKEIDELIKNYNGNDNPIETSLSQIKKQQTILSNAMNLDILPKINNIIDNNKDLFTAVVESNKEVKAELEKIKSAKRRQKVTTTEIEPKIDNTVD